MLNPRYLTPSQVATVRDVGDTVMYIAFDILSGDATNDLRHVGTVLSSIGSVILAHYPEVSLAWLRTQDVFYDSKATEPIPPAENDTEKIADAKEAAAAALSSYTATNAAEDTDIMALINKAITDADVTAAGKSGSSFACGLYSRRSDARARAPHSRC